MTGPTQADALAALARLTSRLDGLEDAISDVLNEVDDRGIPPLANLTTLPVTVTLSAALVQQLRDALLN